MTGRSLHGRVVEELGARIVGGDPAPGRRFTTAWVEAEFSVSRSVAREVIRVLESLGMLTSSTRVGCTVQPESAWRVLDPHIIRWQLAGPQQDAQLRTFIELRAGLEPQAARLAAERGRDADVAALRRSAATMARLGAIGAGDSPAFLAADVEFHGALMTASGNLAYRALIPTLTACLEGRTAEGLTPAQPAAVNLQRHVELAEAVADGDRAAAEAAARSIVSVVWREVR